MNNKNLQISFFVDQSANEVFNAVSNIAKWWTENVKGNAQKLNDEFTVQFEDIHFSKQQLVEVVPNKKVVWLVVDAKLNFVANKKEWNGTRITFDIAKKGDKTQVRFTHAGLAPEHECYEDCSSAWDSLVKVNLRKLIVSGQRSTMDEI